MRIIGLTGGIGSGKGKVEELFAGFGVPVIDADRIARQIVSRGSEALGAIVRIFGEDFLTESGDLNRAALRKLIFKSVQAKQSLEAILHPRIYCNIEQWTGQQTASYVIHVIPLLFEKGLESTVDRILVVDCSEQQQRERVVVRDGVTSAHVQAIMDVQLSRDQRLAGADDVLDNHDGVTDQAEAVALLHEKYRLLKS